MFKKKFIFLFLFALSVFEAPGMYLFGVKSDQEEAKHVFHLCNGGRRDMRIVAVRSSCSCAVGKADFTEIPPAGTAKVDCQIDLRNLSGDVKKHFWVQVAWLGKTTDDVKPIVPQDDAIVLKGTESVIVLTMQGHVETWLKLDKTEAAFRDASPVTLSLEGKSTAKMTEVVSPTDSLFQAAIAEDGRSLTVMPRGKLPNENIVEHWRVKTDDEKIAELPFTVSAFSQALLQPLPAVLRLTQDDMANDQQVLLRPRDRRSAVTVKSVTVVPSVGQAELVRQGRSWRIVLLKGLLQVLPAESELVVAMDDDRLEPLHIPIIKEPIK